jgi:hypothetical protein
MTTDFFLICENPLNLRRLRAIRGLPTCCLFSQKTRREASHLYSLLACIFLSLLYLLVIARNEAIQYGGVCRRFSSGLLHCVRNDGRHRGFATMSHLPCPPDAKHRVSTRCLPVFSFLPCTLSSLRGTKQSSTGEFVGVFLLDCFTAFAMTGGIVASLPCPMSLVPQTRSIASLLAACLPVACCLLLVACCLHFPCPKKKDCPIKERAVILIIINLI